MMHELLVHAYDGHSYVDHNGNPATAYTRMDTYMHYEWLHAALNRLEVLEEAYDKVCGVMTSRVNIDRGDGHPTQNFTKEQWKEWGLKNLEPSEYEDVTTIKVRFD